MDQEPNANDLKRPEGITRPMASALAIVVGLTRLVPFPWNFSPAGAVELFSGARLRSWHAFALPLLLRVVTDLVLLPIHWQAMTKPYYYLTFMPFVYASVIINVFLGRLLSRTESPWKIGSCAVLASAQFYLLSNFSTWIGSDIYPHTLSGLTACYAAGLAFFRPTFLGDLFFCGVLFGVHAWLSRTVFSAERVPELAR